MIHFASIYRNSLLLKWPFAIGVALLARVLCLNMVKLFFCAAMTLPLHVNLMDQTSAKAPWVIDEERVLSPTVSMGISQVLNEAAKESNIHVRVIVVNYKGENALAKSKQKMLEIDSMNSPNAQNKTVYLVLNASTHESYFFAGDEVKRTPALLESISRIESRIITPSLENGNIENAAREGSVALITIVEQWPGAPEILVLQKIMIWLDQHHLLAFSQILAVIAFLLGMGVLLRRYLRRPIAEQAAFESNAMSLEESMLLNSIVYRRYQNTEPDNYNS